MPPIPCCARENFLARRVEAPTDDANRSSCRVRVRLAFALEGTLRNERIDHDGSLRNTRGWHDARRNRPGPPGLIR
jgi:RimJ/RimL family protein N-acetyltransferase